MLGASRTHLSHKWTPRASGEGAGAFADGEALGGGGAAGTAAAAWEGVGSEQGGAWSEMEEPLLAPSSSLASSQRGGSER